MTHQELICITAEKIQTLFRCGLVLKEPKSIRLNFSPDIFAVKKGGATFQFEIKVSRSDFLKDINKPHRKESLDVGAFRYFVVPWGLVKPDEIFFKEGHMKKWGLIWVGQGETHRFKIVRGANPKNNLRIMETPKLYSDVEAFRCQRNSNAEMELVYSAYRALVLGSAGQPIHVNAVVDRLCDSPTDVRQLCARIV